MWGITKFSLKLLSRVDETFPYVSVWIPEVPKKVCFFMWLATREVILMAENLRKWKVVCLSWCFLWRETGEDVEHICYIANKSRGYGGYLWMIWRFLGDAKICEGVDA